MCYVKYIISAGFDQIWSGEPKSLTIDCNDKANVGYETRQSTANKTPTLTLRAINAKNCRMVTIGYFASGIIAVGKMHVSLDGCKVENISRAAGTGVQGSSGTHDIIIADTGGLYPKTIDIGYWEANNITTDDKVGSPDCVDLTGYCLRLEIIPETGYIFETATAKTALAATLRCREWAQRY